MKYFKRFGDFGSGFCCFMAWIHLFGQYMTYKPIEEAEGLREKLKLFLSETVEYDNLLLFVLGVTFLVSAIIGVAFAKYPQISAIFTLPPLALTFDMIRAEYIKEYPMLYAFFGVVALVACLFDCVTLDRRDGGNRCGWCGGLISAATSLLMFVLYSRWKDVAAIEDTTELSRFDGALLTGAETTDMKLLLTFAVVYVILALITCLHKDIYFIDALLAVPPFVALIYMWNAEIFEVHTEVVLTFTGAVLGVRLIAMISGKASVKSKKTDVANAFDEVEDV